MPQNLYALFLNLPEEVTAPDHYQLLGLERFTDDEEAIRNATANQNGELMKWQNADAYHKRVREMMLELVVARQVLLDPEQKQAYDATFEQIPALIESAEEFWGEAIPLHGETEDEFFSVENSIPDYLKPRPLYQRIVPSVVVLGTVVTLFLVWKFNRPNADTTSDELNLVTREDSSLTDNTPIPAEIVLSDPKPPPIIEPADEAKSSTAEAPIDESKADQKVWADSLGKQVVETNVIGMKLVLIPPGSFRMGESNNAVSVNLTTPFFLGQTEVTQRQWQQIMGTTPWQGKSDVKSGPEFAATYVKWNDALAFCNKLTLQDQQSGLLPSGWAYTFPTEAQWEFACRAGTSTKFSFGDDEAQLGKYAWFNSNALDVDQYTRIVGQKQPNAYGLYDMHGNVWEWCHDWYHNTLTGGTDPDPTSASTFRVVRGGGWNSQGRQCSSSFRSDFSPDDAGKDLGFRVVAISTLGTDQVVGAASPTLLKAVPSEPKPLTAPFDATQAKKGQKRWADSIGKQVVESNSIGMRLVLIPPGDFLMGESNNAVSVTLTQPFFLGQTEVTQGQWEQVMSGIPWRRATKGNVHEGPNYPATYTSWGFAMDFCKKLTIKDQAAGYLPEGWAYTLPTEAQWEYACRAGTTTRYSFGDDISKISDYALFRYTGTGGASSPPFEVGQRKPNPFGLFDVHGNAMEWCRDKYKPQLPGGINPEVVARTRDRVRRGGSTFSRSTDCRSSYRSQYAPNASNSALGFRVSLVLPAEAE